MKILVVQESDWLEKGPHQSHHLLERLASRGHKIRVIDYEILWRNRSTSKLFQARREFPGTRRLTCDGAVDVFRPAFIRLPVLDYISMAYTHRKEISHQMREFRPDIIVGFGILNAAIAIRLSKQNRIPFVYYIIDELHRLIPQEVFRGIGGIIESSNMTQSNIVISINEALREYTIEKGAQRERTYVIRAGVDLGRFGSVDKSKRELIRSKHGFTDEDIVLFFMGWLYSFSGLQEVVRELSRSKWKNSKMKLLIVGTGELEPVLLSTIGSNNLTNKVVLESWKTYDEIPEYLSVSDICILPAHDTGIMRNIVPIKMYEYMAAGKPVIATSLRGITREFGVGHGVTFVERPEDTLEEAASMIRRGELSLEGDKSRKFVEGSTWENAVDAFESRLRNVVEEMRNASKPLPTN